MRKALFLLNYRGGSNLFSFLNGCPGIYSIQTKEDHFNPDISEEDRLVKSPGWQETPTAYWMATVPPRTCISEHIYTYPIKDMIKLDLPLNLVAWQGNVGDWWGEVSSHEEVPGPYDYKTFYRFSSDELSSLSGDWRFIYLIRDGRNQIESFRNIRGGCEEQKLKEDAKDYFMVLCKGYRNRARVALDCQKALSNFKMFYFEDLVKDPISTMKSVYRFLDLEIDESHVKRALSYSIAVVKPFHSSFNSTCTTSRWHSWTDWEMETFNSIAGKELSELGYS
jgi:hypothetical protein